MNLALLVLVKTAKGMTTDVYPREYCISPDMYRTCTGHV